MRVVTLTGYPKDGSGHHTEKTTSSRFGSGPRIVRRAQACPRPFIAGELRLIVDAIVMPISHRTVEDRRTTGPYLRRAREAGIDRAVRPASHTDCGVVGWELVQLVVACHLHSVSSAKIQATRDGGHFHATGNGPSNS